MSFTKLETFIFDKLSQTKLPGLSAAILQDGEMVWARGFGFRDLARGQAATPNTLYAIASLTKSFTCVAILQLAEQGQLSVDDPIDRYVPVNIRPGGEPIRIKHLMSHSSGLPALAYAESLIDNLIGDGDHWLPVASYNDMFTFLQDAGEWAVTRPGERWFYLNEGFVLLGAIIEKCAGIPYIDYIQRHILAPLGMKRSFFQKEAVESDLDVATPYIIARDGERIASRYPYGALSSDGGLFSNAPDLLRYLAMFLGQGQYNGVKLLTPASVTAMMTPYVNVPQREGPFGQAGYGYGLRITPNFLGHTLVGHGGSVGVATSYIGFIPEKNIGMALVTNGSGYPTGQMVLYGLALVLGANPEELPFVQRERRLKELEGRYETYKGAMKLQVRCAGDFLMAEMKTKHTDATTILVPDTLEEKTRTFFILESGYKIGIEFTVQDGAVDLLYERYRLKKVGNLV